MKKYNLILNAEKLETVNTKQEAENYIKDTKSGDYKVAAKIIIKENELDFIESLNYIKNIISDVVNEICRSNFRSRELRKLAHYDKDLAMSNISDSGFCFEMGKDFYEDELKNDEYALYGNYVNKKDENVEGIRMWFKGNPGQTDYRIKYEIVINFSKETVSIEADAKEEFVAENSFPEIKFKL